MYCSQSLFFPLDHLPWSIFQPSKQITSVFVCTQLPGKNMPFPYGWKCSLLAVFHYHECSICNLCDFKNYFLKKINLFISFILFLAVLGLCCCTPAFSSHGERGLLFIAARGLLIVVASLVVEYGL